MIQNNYTDLEIIPAKEIKQVITDKLNSAEYKKGIVTEGKKFYGDIDNKKKYKIGKRPYKIGFRPGLVFTLKETAEYIGISERTIMNLQRKLGIIPLRQKNIGYQKYKNFYTMYDILKMFNYFFVRKSGHMKGSTHSRKKKQ